MRLLAIVPAYNEAQNLPHVLEALGRVPGLDVCVVDDGSGDETAKVAASMGATVLRLPVHLGIGGAVQTGYRWAFEKGYEVAVQVDADDQHDPAFLTALLEPLEAGRADLVIGSRFLSSGEGEGFRSTALRRAGIRYLSLLLRLRGGVRVTDPPSGFRAASRKAIALFARHYPSDYPEPEADPHAARAGHALLEVPVSMRPRRHGRSGIGAAAAAYYLAKRSVSLLLLPAREPPGRDDGVRA